MKVITWISNLSTLVKGLLVFVSLAGVISGFLIWHADYVIKKNTRQITEQSESKQLTELQSSFESFNYSFKGFQEAVMDSISSLSTTVQETNKQVEQDRQILIGIRSHMIKSATKEDVLNIFKIWEDAEKKKNGIEIPLKETQQN